MYELCEAGPSTWYIDCPSKIGICKIEHGVYTIDSGNDKAAGRKVRQVFNQQGWKLTAILSTHFHTDHVGVNRYLQQQFNCRIFTESVETAFIEHPILEPSYLFGGCAPADLRHKFLMAQESVALPLNDAACPQEIKAVPFPGHYFGQVGYRTPDDVFFIADVLCSHETLNKYTITVLYDVVAELRTLDYLEPASPRLYVPAHALVTADIKELVQENREKYLWFVTGFWTSAGNRKTLMLFCRIYLLSMVLREIRAVCSCGKHCPVVSFQDEGTEYA